MQAVKNIPLVMLFGCASILANGRALAQGSPPATQHTLKAAIICGGANDTKGDEAGALLAAGLSGCRDVAFVERQAVRTVLDEQKLQSISDTAAAINIGRLVSADLLILGQTVKASKPPLMRLQIVEIASGIILLDELDEVQALTAKPEAFRQKVEAAARKAAIPVPDRKLVGIIGVASEEPGKSLDPLAASLDVLLRTELAHAPGVVVLEREQLQHLTAEHALSGLDVKLRTSSRLLEFRIKRAQGAQAKDKLEVAVKITEMTGGKAKTLNVSLPANDLKALRHELAAETLKALDAALPPDAPGDIHAEAKAFDERSKMLLLHGYLAEALPFALTAYTLDPKIEYYGTLSRICGDIFNNVRPAIDNYVKINGPHKPTLEELNAELLLVQIHSDASHRIAATSPELAEPKKPRWSPGTADFYGLRPFYPLPDVPQTPEQKIVQEIVDLTREDYRLWFELYHQQHWSMEGLNSAYVSTAPFLVRDGAEFCKITQEAFATSEAEEAAGPVNQDHNSPAYPDLNNVFDALDSVRNFGNIRKREDIRPLAAWLIGQKDPMLRLAGYNALAYFPGAEGSDAATKGLDLIFRPKPGEAFHPEGNPPIRVIQLSARLASDGSLRAYTSTLLDELEKSGDATPLVRWPQTATALFKFDFKESLPLLERMQKFVTSKPLPDEYAKIMKYFPKDIAESIKYRKQSLGVPDGTVNPWDSAQVREIKIAAPPDAEALIWTGIDRTRKEPDLLMVWRSEPIHPAGDHADFTLVVGRMHFEGGKVTELARQTISGPVHSGYGHIMGFRITSVLPTPEGIFIADFKRGLMVARDGKITQWTEKEGLASNQIWSLAWSGNTLYAGADDGFMTIDPKTGQCKTLASANAITADGALNGGTPYRINNILPSPDGKSLWLSVGGDKPRIGVWRYELSTGTFTHTILKPEVFAGNHGPGPAIAWHDEKLLVLGAGSGLYDPNSGALIKAYRGSAMYDIYPTDMFPEEGSSMNHQVPIGYTPQQRVVLTSIGFITQYGNAVQLPENEQSLRKSRIATPALSQNWSAIEEFGPGFFAAIYDLPSYNATRKAALWYFTLPNDLPPAAPKAP